MRTRKNLTRKSNGQEITTRDVRWLKTSYVSWKKQHNDNHQEESDEEINSENEDYQAAKKMRLKDDAEPLPTNQPNQRVVRELKRMSGCWIGTNLLIRSTRAIH
jgi:hypothetical protein